MEGNRDLDIIKFDGNDGSTLEIYQYKHLPGVFFHVRKHLSLLQQLGNLLRAVFLGRRDFESSVLYFDSNQTSEVMDFILKGNDPFQVQPIFSTELLDSILMMNNGRQLDA